MHGKWKIILLVVVLIFSLLTAVTALASDIVYTKDEVKETEETLVNITKPLKNEIVASRTILLVGNTDYTNVKIELYIGSDDGYRLKTTTDGVSSWTIGKSGFFSKEIELNKGVNELMIRASKAGKPDQFSLFTVKVVEESLKDIIKNRINSLFNKIAEFLK